MGVSRRIAGCVYPVRYDLVSVSSEVVWWVCPVR